MRNQSPSRMREGLGVGLLLSTLCLAAPTPNPSSMREGGQ